MLVMRRHAWHLMSHIVPPLLLQQKSLRQEAEGRISPLLRFETAIAWQWFDTGRRTRPKSGCRSVRGEARGLLDPLPGQFGSLAWRRGQVHRPVHIGESQGRRGKTTGNLAGQGTEHAVDGAESLEAQDRLRQRCAGLGVVVLPLKEAS